MGTWSINHAHRRAKADLPLQQHHAAVQRQPPDPRLRQAKGGVVGSDVVGQAGFGDRPGLRQAGFKVGRGFIPGTQRPIINRGFSPCGMLSSGALSQGP